MTTLPELGGIMVAIMRNSVDFPAPSEPTRPKIVPFLDRQRHVLNGRDLPEPARDILDLDDGLTRCCCHTILSCVF